MFRYISDTQLLKKMLSYEQSKKFTAETDFISFLTKKIDKQRISSPFADCFQALNRLL